MKARREPLQPGHLDFGARGAPVSARYGDIHPPHSGALAQARDVFLRGNDLPRRWAGRDGFTVCETGFGRGNNFLALWQAWRDSPERPRQLHVVAFEAHPLSREDLATALAGHEGVLREQAAALLRAWPPLLPGLHRLEFEGGRLTLTLAFGRVEYLARQVEARVDAFFLDGLAPARNPAMGSRELFGQLVRIANQGATLATWCSVEQVRRNLADAGFLVSGEAGIDGKCPISRAVLRPGLGRPLPPTARRDSVIVIGGGLAGAGVAYSLALRGHAVTVLDPAFKKGPAGSHEGHRSAAMTPALSRDDNPMSRLSRAGILLGRMRWQRLDGIASHCGSLMRIEPAEAEAWRQALADWRFPAEWASWCDAADTEARCGLPLSVGGVWLPAGTLLRPARLVSRLLAHEHIEIQARQVAGLCQDEDGWQAVAEDGSVLASAPRAVIAAAADAPALLAAAMPGQRCAKLARVQRIGGQVGYFRAGAAPASRAIVAGAGYWLPADHGVHVGGSTYDFNLPASVPTPQGFAAVAHKVSCLLDVAPDVLMEAGAQPDGWAGWRAAVSDHLPVIGPVDAQESLWLACAYGSRGLSWMTLAGEVMAARLNGEPLPIERELLQALRPR